MNRVRAALDWLLRNRETGRWTIAQVPNAALWTFLAASLFRRVADPAGTTGTVVAVVATGALLWWAGDEVLRGVNPWRRILGTTVLVVTVVGLLTG